AEAIRQLKARYFRFLDTKQWAPWRQLFTGDARFGVTAVPEALDADSFVAAVARNQADTRTVHQGHNEELVSAGDGVARGIWALNDLVERPPELERPSTIGYGHYEEEYRREADGWRIASLRLS